MSLANEFTTRGRIGRTGFWLRQLAWIAIVVVALFISALALYAGDWLAVAGFTGLVATAIASTAGSVSMLGRRLHDRGHSAWWVLASFVPLANIWLLVECGFLPGRPDGARFDFEAAVPSVG